jgi:hypothetical protein
MREGFHSELRMMPWPNRGEENEVGTAVAYQAFGVVNFKRKVKALAALELH